MSPSQAHIYGAASCLRLEPMDVMKWIIDNDIEESDLLSAIQPDNRSKLYTAIKNNQAIKEVL